MESMKVEVEIRDPSGHWHPGRGPWQKMTAIFGEFVDFPGLANQSATKHCVFFGSLIKKRGLQKEYYTI